jgi:arginyl-tRNA synthetase
VADLHRKYITFDPHGTKVFEPYLQHVYPEKLDLSRLESLYTFVSALTEAPAAEREWIPHSVHGDRRLSEIPRLTTKFLQDPSGSRIQDPLGSRNHQEYVAWQKARRITLDTSDEIYRKLDVQLAQPELQSEPIVRGESFYNDRLAAVVSEMLDKQIATRSEGAVVVQVPGFEAPLLIQKSDGSYLYGTTDLAALRFRLTELHAGEVIYTTDSRQSQHFAQVFWTARQAGWVGDADLEFAPFGTMLGEDGKPFKTRSGDTVKLKELLDEAEDRAFTIVSEKNGELPEARRRQIAHAVGVGGVKYADLSKDRVSDYVFSWDRMLATEGNTGPYLQYAHARIQSVFRKAGAKPTAAKVLLDSPYEQALAKHLLRFGDTVSVVSRELTPHHLCAYLYELASKFSGFYENCPVIKSEEPLRSSRLSICALTARTIELGLDLLGIEHPDEM